MTAQEKGGNIIQLISHIGVAFEQARRQIWSAWRSCLVMGTSAAAGRFTLRVDSGLVTATEAKERRAAMLDFMLVVRAAYWDTDICRTIWDVSKEEDEEGKGKASLYIVDVCCNLGSRDLERRLKLLALLQTVYRCRYGMNREHSYLVFPNK